MKLGIPVTWLKEKGIKCVEGDKATNTNDNIGFYLTHRWAHVINSGGNKHWEITAFADRENTGTQPVPDWVPVTVELDNVIPSLRDIAPHFLWSDASLITSWKPNIEALFVIYVAEQRGEHACDDSLVIEPNTMPPFPSPTQYEQIIQITEFLVANKIGLPDESCVDTIKRELAEKHDIDMRSDTDKLQDAIVDALQEAGAENSWHICEQLLASDKFTITLNGDENERH